MKMDGNYSQIFEMDEDTLYYNSEKSILLCRKKNDHGNRWVKKLADIFQITVVTEDNEAYYLSCELGDTEGQFVAVKKSDGATLWFIPGRSYFHLLFDDFIYLIFIDEKGLFYLLKIDKEDGRKIWHHRIDEDLDQYNFRSDRIQLKYHSGREEKISPVNGKLLQ